MTGMNKKKGAGKAFQRGEVYIRGRGGMFQGCR